MLEKSEGRMKFNAVVDRIEKTDNGDIAVMETEELGHFDFPAGLLPSGVHEGGFYVFEITEDPQGEENLKNEIDDLQRKLLERTKKRSK